MDTTTVLEIIKMIETQIKWTDCKIQSLPLRSLQKHLQLFVDTQLNVAENSTNEEDYYYLDWGI
jgi:hypothetical protein